MAEPMTVEQRARDLLERMGVDDAQSFSSGDIVELANLLVEVDKLRAKVERRDQRILELKAQADHSDEVNGALVGKLGEATGALSDIVRAPNEEALRAAIDRARTFLGLGPSDG